MAQDKIPDRTCWVVGWVEPPALHVLVTVHGAEPPDVVRVMECLLVGLKPDGRSLGARPLRECDHSFGMIGAMIVIEPSKESAH